MLLLLLACANRTDSADPTDSADAGHADSDTDTDAQASYTGGTGPYEVRRTDGTVGGAEVTWYVPTAGAGHPGVVWSHGFARSKANHVDAAEQAASWGLVVVTPTLPSFSDHAGNGAWIAEDLVPELQAHDGVGDRLALVGHSAGGLATLVAAAEVGPDLWLGLDPVDNGGLGAATEQDVSAEAVFLLGEESDCNADGSGHGWSTAGPRTRVRFADATHCDFEFPSDSLCTAFCGGEDDTRRARILDYAVAFLVGKLGAAEADAWLPGGSQFSADEGRGVISQP